MVKAYASDLITTSPTDREKTLNEETKAHDLPSTFIYYNKDPL